MRQTGLFFLMFISLLALLAGCGPELAPARLPADAPTAGNVPDGVQAPGANSLGVSPAGTVVSKLGAAALMVQEERGDNAFSIVPVSADSGEPVDGFQPIALGGEFVYGFSNDRSQMAFLSNRTEGCLKYCLRILDLTNWQETITPIPVDKDQDAYFIIPEFDQAADRIPLILHQQNGAGGEIVLVDREQGSVAARVPLKANILGLAVTPAGDLALRGVQTNSTGAGPLMYVALLDGGNYKPLWEKIVSEVALFDGDVSDHTDPLQGVFYEPAIVFSKDGTQLFIAAADKPELITVDFRDQAIRTAQVARRTSWLERLLTGGVRVAHAKFLNGVFKVGALSADGRYLYVVGQEVRSFLNERGEFQSETSSLGFQVIDTEDGALVESVSTEATYLALSQDGKTLMLHGWQSGGENGRSWTDVMDTASLTVTQRLDGRAFPSHLMDGSPAWLATGAMNSAASTIDIYRPGESAPSVRIARSGYFDWVMVP